MAELDIRSLTCVKKQDQNPKDEVSLLINGIRVFGPQNMANGDTIAIPLGNQAFTGELFVELLEEDNGGASSLQLGAVRIPDFLPGEHDFFGVFDDELPGAFYFMKYQIVP
jgi:hypothetical protein